MMPLAASPIIKIDSRVIGEDYPVYFIAEIGSNFDQDLNRAKDLIYLAKEAGADAAKFQHYTAQSLVSDHGFKQLNKAQSHQANWKKSVYDTYEAASLERDFTQVLKETCDEVGISFFTSPYSMELVDYVNEYVPAYKIGSGDITWIEIVEYISKKEKPVLLATGASDMSDVVRAVDSILNINLDLVLMQCNTNYTADIENSSHLQLNVISKYRSLYPGIITGLSDHMPGHIGVLGAVALGARVIEKHFTDSTDRQGPDHSFSLTPKSWRKMVTLCRELEEALGDGEKKIEANEQETCLVQRRCIRANKDLATGHVLTREDISILRPCPEDGIPPYDVTKTIRKTITRDIKSGEYIGWNDLNE
jgi:N-acetylneuraminate synthase